MQNTITLPADTIARLAVAIAAINGPRFVGLTYRNQKGELARHIVIIGASYENALAKSRDELTAKLHTLNEVETVAAHELIASWSKSLMHSATGTVNPDNTQKDSWETIVPGFRRGFSKVGDGCVKVTNGKLQILGMAQSKTVLEAGVYPHVNSSAKTLAKNALTQSLPAGKWRSFSVEGEALQSVRIGGQEIEVS